MNRKPMHWLDWVVFAASITISMGIGLFFAFTGGKQRTTKEYLMANRQLSVLPTSLSMFMSVVSAIFVLGQTAEVYYHGIQVIIGHVAGFCGYIVTVIIFVPLFYKLKLVSFFEYITMRFGSNRKAKVLKSICVIIQIFSGTLYMGVAMYAPATAFEAATGFQEWTTIVIVGVVTTIYTTLGGMKAVVWTDAFQGIVMFVGLITILVASTVKVGGYAKVWEIAGQHGRLNLFNFDPHPTVRMSFWTLFLTNFLSFIFEGTTQTNVQRYCALPSLKKARMAVLCLAIFQITARFISVFGALSLFAYFTTQGCDPLRGRLIKNQNQILPYFIVNVLGYPALSGLFLAVLFSGAASSVSSQLNGLSAITWQSLAKHRFKNLKKSRKALVTKIFAVCYGTLAIVTAFVTPYLSGNLLQIAMQLISSASAPLNGICSMGSLIPFINAVGASIGGIGGFIIASVINIGIYISKPQVSFLSTVVDNCTFAANITARPVPTNPSPGTIFPLFRISFLLVSPLIVLITILIGVVAAIILGGEKPERKSRRYIVPLAEYLCCCCPVSVQKLLLCGLQNNDKEKEPIQIIKNVDIQEETYNITSCTHL